MAYFRDWFGRSEEEAFTKYDRSRRTVHWDKGYDNYSDFFFGRKSGLINQKDAASLLLTMSKVMEISTHQYTKSVADKATTSDIVLPVAMLQEKGVTTDIFLGAALQNVAYSKYQSKAEKLSAEKLSKKPTIESIVYSTLNAERVNNLMAEDAPGYLKFVQKFKEHTFKSRPAVIEGDKKDKRLLELFDRIIRYPTQITDEELEEFKEPLDKIQDIIKKAGGIPPEGSKCQKVSNQIGSVIRRYIEEPPESEDESKEEGDKDSKKSGLGDPKGERTGDPSAFSTPEELAKFLKELEQTMKNEKTQKSEDFSKFMDEYRNQEELSSSKIDTRKVKIIHPELTSVSKDQYKRFAKKVDLTKSHVLQTLLKRKNRDYQFCLKSMRSGRLDTNKLAEAKQMVQTIYERIGSVKTNKLCVGILVDESGSMHGYPIEYARQAAIFLNESLKGVKDVELFIYGHTADNPLFGGSGTTQLFVYKEKDKVSDAAIGEMGKHLYENRDGVAMITAARRMRQQTQNNGIFICISDGCPAAHGYSGPTANTHVRRMAIEIEKMGFQVIQVTIGGYRSKNMFKHVINMDDITTFPQQFVTFLKTKIDTMIKEKVTV